MDRGSRPLLANVVVVLFGVSAVAAALLLSFGSIRSSWLWAQAPFAVLAGAAVAILLAEREETRNAARLLLVLLLGSAVLAGLAAVVATPFARLRFTTVLGPRLAGVLPAGVPFLFVGVVGGSIAAARSLLGRPRPGRREPLRLAAATASVVTLVSLSLDPVARTLQLWSFSAPGRFDGVPLSTFATRWAACLLLAVVAFAVAPGLRILRDAAPAGPILALLALQLLLLAVAVRAARPAASLGAAATSVILAFAFLRARRGHADEESEPAVVAGASGVPAGAIAGPGTGASAASPTGPVPEPAAAAPPARPAPEERG